MKLTLGIVVFVLLAFILFAKWHSAKDASIIGTSSVVQSIASSTAISQAIDVSPSSSSKSMPVASTSASSLASNLNSLSGPRVEPLPEIVNFLRQLDNAVIPKIYLPVPKRNSLFNYSKAKPSELRELALADDPYAAYFYAEFLVRNGVRTITDKGDYAYELDIKKRALAMSEAREFYIRGFRGGIASIAEVLSRLYANPSRGGNRIESLAWRKISFSVGESQRYDCLRNSTICVVKDFNNLNRLDYFYPCLSASGDSCTQTEYDTAMMFALEYADSLEFAMNNKVGQ